VAWWEQRKGGLDENSPAFAKVPESWDDVCLVVEPLVDPTCDLSTKRHLPCVGVSEYSQYEMDIQLSAKGILNRRCSGLPVRQSNLIRKAVRTHKQGKKDEKNGTYQINEYNPFFRDAFGKKDFDCLHGRPARR
jgi:hypothetical protein